jgi:hypothetical protein
MARGSVFDRRQGVSFRASLTEIDPNGSVVADFFSDGTDLDTGVVIDAQRCVYEFGFRYRPSATQRASFRTLEPSAPGLSADQIKRTLAQRHQMDADIVHWQELSDEGLLFAHSRQIRAGRGVLDEEDARH